MSEEVSLRDAEFARPWREGEPWPRQHVYPRTSQPLVEVRIGGAWCPARATMRQHRADGQLVYHLDVYLPGETSTAHRAVVWRPGSICLH